MAGLLGRYGTRTAFGMDLNAIDVPNNEKIFSLATITNAGDLEAAREVDLDKVTDEMRKMDSHLRLVATRI